MKPVKCDAISLNWSCFGFTPNRSKRFELGRNAWNGYRNKSQHRKLTLAKKFLPPLLPGFEPATFRSRIQRSNIELSNILVVQIMHNTVDADHSQK